MNPTLNILPQCSLELRPLPGDALAPAERSWLLCSRDDRARAMWEVVLNAPVLHALLENLAEGQATVSAGNLQLQIYPDVELERTVMNWATRQLARYASVLAGSMLPRRLGLDRVQSGSVRPV